MRRYTDGMFDLRDEKCVVKYGNGAHSTSTVVGVWAEYLIDKGTRKKVVLDEVTVVPGSAYNLSSLTHILNKGKIETDWEIMKLVCQGETISFDQRIVSSNGFLLVAKFKLRTQIPPQHALFVNRQPKFKQKTYMQEWAI
jgi:hypothetical protein